MAEEYVTICEVCAKGITKKDLKFDNGRSFHNGCFAKQGKEFPKLDYNLQSKTTQAKLDLIQLKNLKHRLSGGNTSRKSSSKRKTAKKSTRKSTRRTAAKRKTAKKSTRKSTRRTAAKRR